MAKCKGCGQEIIWIMSPSGKAIPCDPEPVNYWRRLKAKGKVVTRNGEVVSCDFEGDLAKCTGIGFVPHWATCTKAGGLADKDEVIESIRTEVTELFFNGLKGTPRPDDDLRFMWNRLEDEDFAPTIVPAEVERSET